MKTEYLDNPISIHVLREEDDCTMIRAYRCSIQISIHVLREEDDESRGLTEEFL